jgi:hypothetical protein
MTLPGSDPVRVPWVRMTVGSISRRIAYALVWLLLSAGCAARPLDLPTGGLPLKCATFARTGNVFLNLTCASKDVKEPDKTQ